MKEILFVFVCTGNTCRSPMAEGLFKNALSAHPKLSSQYTAASAGISAPPGLPASENAIETMRSCYNIDISGHRSAPVTRDLIDRAFLVVTMTASQRDILKSLFPEFQDKIYILKEYISEGRRSGYATDITDPYGCPLHVYKSCASEIESAILALLELL